MFKNVASQSLTLSAFDSANGTQKTGDAANMVFYVDIDDAGPNAISSNSGVPTEISSTNAKGDYKIALTQGETNGNKLNFTGKSSTSGIVVVSRTYYTYPANFTLFAVDGSGRIDLGKILGTASAGAVGYVGVDWAAVANKTTTNALTGTTIATTQKVDVETIKTQAVVAAATVTFPATLVGTSNLPTSFGALVISSRGSLTVSRWDNGTSFAAVLLDASNTFPNVNSAFVGGQTASAAATVTFPAIIASTTNILDLADGIEVGLTPRQALRLIAAAIAAKSSGGGTTTITFRNAVADSKDRIAATVDGDSNRTAITYDLT